MHTEYAVIMITPDSIRDKLEARILSDLVLKVDIKILWQKYWRINSRKTVEMIYPDILSKASYSAITRTLLMGDCFVLLVEGTEIYTGLKDAKGRIKHEDGRFVVTGLREKYRSWSEVELEQLGWNSSAALEKVFEFRLHTSDDLADTANFCLLCMNHEEILNLRLLAPALYSEMLALKKS